MDEFKLPPAKAPADRQKLKIDYEPPIWSGIPPPGAKLEILKGGNIIRTIPLKDKQYFVFGRLEGSVDILCEHESISRAHCILQFKDTGEAYLYDLGSTHGTKENKMSLPPREHIKLEHSSMFKLGQSTRLYIYSYDKEEEEEEEENDQLMQTESEQSKTRKERMLKNYEEHKKTEEELQNAISKQRSGWNNFNDEADENQNNTSSLLSEEEIKKYGLKLGQQINYSALKEHKGLTDPQKAVIKKAESSIKRIEKLTRELDGIQDKQAKMLDLTDGQQQRYYKLEEELDSLRETLVNQEENIRNMIVNGEEEDNYDEIKAQRNFYKEWENQDFEDEFYDRSKFNKFNKTKRNNKITRKDIKEGDTYENVKLRLDKHMAERDRLMARLIEIDYQEKQRKAQKQEEDEFEAFMNANESEIKSDEKEFCTQKINEVKDEIEKCNQMLTLLMPSSFSTAQKAQPIKPKVQKDNPKVNKKQSKSSKQNENNGLSSVFQKLSSMAKNKEKELKQNIKEPKEEEIASVLSTPRFPQNSEGEKQVSMSDVAPAPAPVPEPASTPNSFFSEIVSNIQPVTSSDSIDTSKYSSFVQQYNQYHDSKAYTGSKPDSSQKRQKTSEEEEISK
ncbi:unnamed protein product [Moneuplotes crassus]|uniref:FHA domain-containing protein n=1 Tax=Euplotes crassus TaxID=5936 RepID=A0AAD1U2Y3_EUPCR|nr:unnamed protein product [Moneuplotes crassus]